MPKAGSKAAAKAKPAKAAPRMVFEKLRPEMRDYFEAVAPGPERGLEKRQMFGAPVRFANGNMCIGLHNNRFILRLGEADRADFLTLPGAAIFEPMKGRPMREYVVVPDALSRDRAALAGWMDRSVAFARGLPPKTKKPKSGAKAK